MHLLASDFDGTLRINEKVSSVDIDKIREFREKGNKFVICTGRSINSVLNQLEIYEIPFDYVIGVNGAIAINPNKEIIYAHDISRSMMDELFKFMENHPVKEYQVSNGIDYIRIPFGEKSDSDILHKDPIRGLYIQLEDDDKAIRFANDINEQLKETPLIAYTNNMFVSIGTKGIHKGYGVEKLSNEIEFKGEIHTVGDDYNDIPMFNKFSSYGIKTGKEDAIKYAKYKVDSVAEAINHILNK